MASGMRRQLALPARVKVMTSKPISTPGAHKRTARRRACFMLISLDSHAASVLLPFLTRSVRVLERLYDRRLGSKGPRTLLQVNGAIGGAALGRVGQYAQDHL